MSTALNEAVVEQDALTLDVRVLSTTFRLAGLSPAAHARLAEDWSRCVRSTPDPYATVVPLQPGRETTVGGLGDSLAAQLTQDAVRQLAGQALLMHACGLSDPAGRVLALIGQSGAGKSTAVRELCRDRFGYVTDETVAVVGDGHVIPYPKPLSLRADPHSPDKEQIGPDELGLRECADRLTIARLVLIERSPDAQVARLERLPLADAILALVPNTSSLAALDEPLQTLCRFIDACGGVFRLHYAQIADAADLLADLLARSPAPAESWAADPRPGNPVDARWGLRDGKVRRRPAQDAVHIDDEVLLMIDDRPVRLTGIGSTLWRAAPEPTTLGELHQAAVDAHGDHPQARQLVEAAVRELAENEVFGNYQPLSVDDVLHGLAFST